jgi:hypothetical protein
MTLTLSMALLLTPNPHLDPVDGLSDELALITKVMPEFDVPGHGSWGKGYPWLMVTDGPCDDTLDPTKQSTYDFLKAFLGEMGDYFIDPYIFLGQTQSVTTLCSSFSVQCLQNPKYFFGHHL